MFDRRKKEDDLDRELRAHIDLEAEALGDRDAAHRALGNVGRIKEEVRSAWGWSMIEGAGQDFRYALRQMRRSPGFTLIAVLTLAIGLGATTIMFSIAHGVLLQPLRYREPGRLFLARTIPPASANLGRDFPVNSMQFNRWHDFCRSCESMGLARYEDLTMVGVGEPVKLLALGISADFFRTLGVQAALGRDFVAKEPGDHVILSDALWRSRFNADPSVIGRAVHINGENYVVIGVMPADLRLPKGDEWGGFTGPSEAPELFRPAEPYDNTPRPAGNLNFSAVIRLKPGVSGAQGAAELNGLLADVYREYDLPTRIGLIPLREQVTRNAKTALWLLLAAVGVVLLIVCVNVGNLMLVRASGRQREAGVRMALGAGRGRLFTLVLEEALLLVAIGGALGLAFASFGLKVTLAVAPAALPRADEVVIDWRVLLFSAAAIVLSTIVCGLLPAWRLSRTQPMESLRAASAASTETGGKLRVREWMVGFEVALCTILLIVGGLLMVSFQHVLHSDAGFDVAHVIAQDVSFLNPKYQHGVRQTFVERIVPKLKQIPGVDIAAATNRLPLIGEDWVSELTDPDHPSLTAGREALANNRFVTPGYWQALGIPLKRGRYLDESDKNKNAAVISERAARFLWGDDDPIGKHVEGTGSKATKLEVVGVVGDVKGAGLERPFTMMIYEHYWRMQPIAMSLIVRTRADPASTASAIHAILAQADPEMALPPALTMEQIVDRTVEARKFQTMLAGSFAIAALLLASLGIYGVISFTVARRTPEIGIRIALGAGRVELLALILKDGMTPVIGGLAAGLIGSALLGQVIVSQLYGVVPRDPWTMSAVAAVVMMVALLACLVPAMRAARIDPLTALRFE